MDERLTQKMKKHGFCIGSNLRKSPVKLMLGHGPRRSFGAVTKAAGKIADIGYFNVGI